MSYIGGSSSNNYIGTKPATTASELILKNPTQEDIEGGRESYLTFKGLQSGGEETVLAQIQASHDGTADDEKGDLIFSTNDGSDGSTPTERMRLDSSGSAVLTGSPDLILHNTQEEDTEGGRESRIIFKGEQSGGEESVLAQIQASHDGTSDDEKGDLIFSTNDGSDGSTPTESFRIESTGVITPSFSYNEAYNAITSSSNAITVDCEVGNSFSHTLTENTTFTFSNAPASGTAYAFSIEIIQDSSASGYTVTWPTSVDFPAATAPTLTATASAIDVFVFSTRDGGTTWYGFTAGQAIATPA